MFDFSWFTNNISVISGKNDNNKKQNSVELFAAIDKFSTVEKKQIQM